MGVVEGGGGLRLGPEAAQERLVVGQRGVQHLDRDPAPQAHVVGQVDLRRRPGAEGRDEPVAPPSTRPICSVMRVMATSQEYGRSQTDAIKGGGEDGPEALRAGSWAVRAGWDWLAWGPPHAVAVRRWRRSGQHLNLPLQHHFKIVAVIVLALAIAAFVAAYLTTSDEGDDELGT